jgi:hypothetical protein
MRAGYKVINDVEKLDRFILVSNYGSINEVINYGCEELQELNYLKDESDIGFWRIKRK